MKSYIYSSCRLIILIALAASSMSVASAPHLYAQTGPVMVKDILIGSGSSNPFDLFPMNTALFFGASDGVFGTEPWMSDGTEAGTDLIKVLNTSSSTGSYPYHFTDLNNTLYFSADDGIYGRELWKSDASGSSAVLVKDIRFGSSGSDPDAPDAAIKRFPQHPFTTVNNTLYFSANDGLHGEEVWKSDGTGTGTALVKDINPLANAGSNPSYLTGFNNELYFAADDGIHGEELWKSDGTGAGTALVKDINPAGYEGSNPAHLFVFNGMLYFSADDGTHGAELWKSDGTEAGTRPVKDINTTVSKSSNPDYFTSFNDKLYFTADDGVHGTEPWKTDGFEAGTMLVKDINPELGAGSNPGFYTPVSTMLYFIADDGLHGAELWRSDGTGAGTDMVKDINPTPDGSSNPYYLTAVNDMLYFAAFEEIHGRELWQSDGSEAGTALVKDIYIGTNSSNPAAGSPYALDPQAGFNPQDPFPIIRSTLYFTADDGIHGSELWRFTVATPITSSSTSITTSTTTTAPPVTTTTALTTTTTSIPCPLSRYLYSREDIALLRSMRTVLLKTPYGTHLTSLYYKHALEVVILLEKHPELQQQVRELISENRDAVRQFIVAGKAPFSGGGETRIIQFLKNLQSEAGPQLENDIEIILRDMQSKSLRDKLEMNMN